MDGNPEPSFLDISTTYVDWTSQFSQILLASNGFKYTGESDIVECVSCGIKLSNWKAGDNVQTRHFKASPNCKYCKDVSVGQNGKMNDNVTMAAGGHFSNKNSMVERPKQLRSQFVPSKSESRLPVPVNIIQDIGGSPRFRFNQEQSDADDKGYLQQHRKMPMAQIAQYQEESARLASYDNWPDSAPVKPPALARAGLYYTGMRDKAKCPFCLGSMYNWEKGDVPLGEHAKHYPSCPFVKHKMYQNLLSDSSNSQENTTQQVLTDTTPRIPSPPPESTAQVVAAGGQDETIENNVAVGIVHKMGFSMTMIREAVERISLVSLSDLKSDKLIDTLYEMEDAGWSEEDMKHGEKSAPESHHLSVIGGGDSEEPLMCPPNAANRNSPTPGGANRITEEPDSASFAGGYSSTDQSFSIIKPDGQTIVSQQTNNQPRQPMNPKYKELSAEHRKLTKRKICNICGQDEVSVLFLPCRHLVACETCSAKLKDCSQCDKLIIGTVKIYFP